MRIYDALKRLDCFPPDATVTVSDFTGSRNHPCCVRKDGSRVVVDFVSEAVSALGQESLSPLNVAQVRHRLEVLDDPYTEVVFSNYNGQEFGAQCVRKEEEEACFDIDGIA